MITLPIYFDWKVTKSDLLKWSKTNDSNIDLVTLTADIPKRIEVFLEHWLFKGCQQFMDLFHCLILAWPTWLLQSRTIWICQESHHSSQCAQQTESILQNYHEFNPTMIQSYKVRQWQVSKKDKHFPLSCLFQVF